MSPVKNQDGIALVTALCFTMISLGIIMMLLYTVTQGTKMTAAYKRYESTLEASYGAVDLLKMDVMPQLLQLTPTSYSTLTTQLNALAMGIGDANCLGEKLSKASWSTTLCGASTKTTTASDTPDMTFNLKATNDLTGYTVYTKIVNTKCGGSASDPCSNSDPNSSGISGLYKPGGTTSAGVQTVQGLPAYYRIEIKGVKAASPREKSELSVLYAY